MGMTGNTCEMPHTSTVLRKTVGVGGIEGRVRAQAREAQRARRQCALSPDSARRC
jgi:hypothetical protein